MPVLVTGFYIDKSVVLSLLQTIWLKGGENE
jgi:hypothetical protein